MRDILKPSLIIAGAYFTGALAGFQLALTPHSPITLFWPPSGIALAAVLVWGRFALPGIFAGALAVNLLLLSESPSWPLFADGVTISAASTMAALLGGVLLRKFAPSAPIWGSARDILNGSLMMAAVCILPATLGSASLFLSGQVPYGALWTTTIMWWLGDFCGMAIFTPLAFTVVRRMNGNFWRPIRPEVIPGPTVLNSLTTLVALGAFIALWTVEERAIGETLQREARVSALSLGQAFQRAARDIESIGAFISAAGHRLDEAEFLEYAGALTSRGGGDSEAYRIGWAPRVTDRKSWEAQMMAKRGADIRIYDFEPPDRMTIAPNRDEYYPVQLLYSSNPLAGSAVGLDLGADPIRGKAIELARDSGQAAIAAPVTLQDTDLEDPQAMQICLPAYRAGGSAAMTGQEHRDRFTGVACGFYPTRLLIGRALTNQAPEVRVHLFDQTDTVSSRWVYTRNDSVQSPTLEDLATGMLGTAKLRFGHRDWVLVATPGPNFEESMRSWIPWGALLLIVTLGIVGSSIMIERVTAQRRLDAEKRRTEDALAEARAANESKSYLMAAASHDIKQPLYALGFLTDTLLMTDPPEATVPVMKNLKKSILEMSHHFDTLMDMGRFQQGGFEAVKTRFSLAELERRIALEIGPMCIEKGLKWVISLADVEVYTDSELLLRLMRNLLINAVRYTDRGEVRCVAVAQGSFVEFTVSDTGPGLTPAQREQIFKDSAPADDQTHLSEMRMGFSIVNKISRALDLDITVNSGPMRGTVFTFRIPVA